MYTLLAICWHSHLASPWLDGHLNMFAPFTLGSHSPLSLLYPCMITLLTLRYQSVTHYTYSVFTHLFFLAYLSGINYYIS